MTNGRLPKLSLERIAMLRFICSKSSLESPLRSMLTVRKIAREMQMAVSTTFGHLVILRDQGCIEDSRIGGCTIEATELGHRVVHAADRTASEK